MELTTPTGAAVVAALARSVGPMKPMKIMAAGHGAGSRDFTEQPNVLRVLIGESSDAVEAVEIDVIEANIDDLSPQVLGYAMDRLMDAGALDVSLQPIQMKKGRPGQLLRVLAKPEDREALSAVVFAETSTLGLRIYKAERRVQERQWHEVSTRYGTVRVKVSGQGSFAPEYEDCRRLAVETGAPLKDILAEASFEYWKKKR
jgi:uncharacterized protein (DUF111 family)